MVAKDGVAVVTGGASGIGRAISRHLARAGWRVAIWDCDSSAARQLETELNELGRRALAVEVDVSSFVEVDSAAQTVRRELGKVSILVNSAGIGEIVPFTQMSEAQWDRMLGVHLKGCFNCTRHLVQDMVDSHWGRIVNISSVAGLKGAPGFSHYAAAKAAMIGFTKSLALELGPVGITVNVIAPGLIDTPILKKSGLSDEIIAAVVQQTPVGRIGTPDDIAACCAFVIAEESSFLSGQVISPNGAMHT